MQNERITEDIVRDTFRVLGYEEPSAKVEGQTSSDPQINKLLLHASKKAYGRGKPDFIITFQDSPSLVCVVECKADVLRHASAKLDKYADYAVDGARLYASYLSKEKDVLFIGVSGQNPQELRVSHYFQMQGAKGITPAFGDGKLLRHSDYITEYKNQRYNVDYSALEAYTRTLNKAFQDNKIATYHRALLFSGILLAFEDDTFRNTYKHYSDAADLAKLLIDTILRKLEKSNISHARRDEISSSYAFIQGETSLIDRGYLLTLVREIDDRVATFIKNNKYTDIISKIYTEFLSYSNSDKGLGIVLTPKHITELFCDLANVNKNSIVLDNCCGTGGFLVSALDRMMKDAGADSEKKKQIRENLIGIEQAKDKYVLSCINMIIHGDGKSNIFKGDCFERIDDVRKNYNPDVGLLNPPYSEEELKFILNNLSAMEKKGTVVAIVPMSSALAQKGSILKRKEELLQQHTLKGVMSMPDDLFYGEDASVVTCIMVFEAGVPHPKGFKTYFGYWKDDGFIKKKHLGRVDGGAWQSKRDLWLSSFMNRSIVQGISLLHEVQAKDEWCYEAYAETDYSTLTEEDFIKTIKDYVSFQFLQGKDDAR